MCVCVSSLYLFSLARRPISPFDPEAFSFSRRLCGRLCGTSEFVGQYIGLMVGTSLAVARRAAMMVAVKRVMDSYKSLGL